MVVSITKATPAVDVAVTVIFNFSAMVAMFTKAAIDFLVTVVMFGHHGNKSLDGYLCYHDYQGYHSSFVAIVRRTR
jgi:hypothetical protein